MISFLTLRCNNIDQVEQYIKMARDIQHSIDDMDIFKLTGCLSKCNKYHYTAIPRGALRDKGVPEQNDVPNYKVQFAILSGKNEVKEQVMESCGNFVNFVTIYYVTVLAV